MKLFLDCTFVVEDRMKKYLPLMILALISTLAPWNSYGARASTICNNLLSPLNMELVLPDLKQYELIRILDLKPAKDFKNFAPAEGIFVTQRDGQGHATEATIRVLADNPNEVVEVVGDFNSWGLHGTLHLHPDPADPRYVIGNMTNIFHGMQYRLLINGQQLIDPAALVQATPEFNLKMKGNAEPYLNSAFWDIEGQGKYIPKSKPVDLRRSAVAVTEIDIAALVKNWRHGNQVGPKSRGETYNFVTQSGIIPFLKSWGINAIEFLPLTASVDGDVWSYRYLNFAPFAVDSRWGTPKEFARMVDAFNQAGIAVVLDVVPAHFPYYGNQGPRDLSKLGMQNFRKADGRSLFGETKSEWDTRRYDFQNPYVRRYLIDGMLNAIKYYGIGGFRIDNYMGIQAQPGGVQFLKELISEIRAYAPATWINGETFGGDNSVTRSLDLGGQGASTHNYGDFFFGAVYPFAKRRTEELDMNVLRNIIRSPYGWKESATLYNVTNHDEASNGTGGGANGAYFASLVSGGRKEDMIGKTRAWSALGMLASSFYLDMPQLRILQQGTFYKNAAVEYDLLNDPDISHLAQYLGDLTQYYTSHPEFAFYNTHPDIENHVDNDHKVATLHRIDRQSNRDLYAVINMGHHEIRNYRFGVPSEGGSYAIVLDSSGAKYGGPNENARVTQQRPLSVENIGAHGRSHSLNLPYLPPYGVLILEKR